MTNVRPASWRSMTPSDLARVETIGTVVHPDHPEDAAVIAERLHLYPAGCLVLDGEGGIRGYAVAHPWLHGQPPPLDTRLGRLPARADTFHIHDIAMLPDRRGSGAGTEVVEWLARQARREAFTSMSLVAVGDSPRFWCRMGFQPVDDPATRMALATYRGALYMTRPLP